jgi:hypothetical protein
MIKFFSYKQFEIFNSDYLLWIGQHVPEAQVSQLLEIKNTAHSRSLEILDSEKFRDNVFIAVYCAFFVIPGIWFAYFEISSILNEMQKLVQLIRRTIRWISRRLQRYWLIIFHLLLFISASAIAIDNPLELGQDAEKLYLQSLASKCAPASQFLVFLGEQLSLHLIETGILVSGIVMLVFWINGKFEKEFNRVKHKRI